MDFTKIIIILLRDRKFTEETLALELDCSQSTVNRIKNGQIPKWDIGNKLILLQSHCG
jgi:hypothetical protein